MDLKGMFSLYTFYRSLDEVFDNDSEHYTSSLYASLKDTNGGGNFLCKPIDGVMGKYFEPVICIGFCDREGWGRPINTLLMPKLDSIPETSNSSKPYEEEGAVWFDFKRYEEFNKSSLDEQVALLREFFNDVMLTIQSQKENA